MKLCSTIPVSQILTFIKYHKIMQRWTLLDHFSHKICHQTKMRFATVVEHFNKKNPLSTIQWRQTWKNEIIQWIWISCQIFMHNLCWIKEKKLWWTQILCILMCSLTLILASSSVFLPKTFCSVLFFISKQNISGICLTFCTVCPCKSTGEKKDKNSSKTLKSTGIMIHTWYFCKGSTTGTIWIFGLPTALLIKIICKHV